MSNLKKIEKIKMKIIEIEGRRREKLEKIETIEKEIEIETMNINSSYDENDYYGCIDDANYINDYDGVEDYYLDYSGYVDDDEIVNCKKNNNIIDNKSNTYSLIT